MTDIRKHGFRTKAEFDEHLADAEEAVGEGVAVDETQPDEMQEDLTRARRELALLREQLAGLHEEAESVVSGRPHPDAGRRTQPGLYPLLTLAGAVTLTVFAATAIFALPFAGMPFSRFERR